MSLVLVHYHGAVVSDLCASIAVFLTLLTQEVFLVCCLVLPFNVQINVLEPVAVTVSVSAACWKVATDTLNQVSYLQSTTQNTEREIKLPPDYLSPQIPHSFSSCEHDIIPQHVLIYIWCGFLKVPGSTCTFQFLSQP